jgi:hypothetical protein
MMTVPAARDHDGPADSHEWSRADSGAAGAVVLPSVAEGVALGRRRLAAGPGPGNVDGRRRGASWGGDMDALNSC